MRTTITSLITAVLLAFGFTAHAAGDLPGDGIENAKQARAYITEHGVPSWVNYEMPQGQFAGQGLKPGCLEAFRAFREVLRYDHARGIAVPVTDFEVGGKASSEGWADYERSQGQFGRPTGGEPRWSEQELQHIRDVIANG